MLLSQKPFTKPLPHNFKNSMTSLISLQKISKTFSKDHKGSRYSTFSISRLVLANPRCDPRTKQEVENPRFCPSLAGLDHPEFGSVTINGQDLSVLKQDELSHFRAQNLGIVFQQYHLMNNLTTLENAPYLWNCKKPKTMRHPPAKP